jgi:hypothetical protein
MPASRAKPSASVDREVMFDIVYLHRGGTRRAIPDRWQWFRSCGNARGAP